MARAGNEAADDGYFDGHFLPWIANAWTGRILPRPRGRTVRVRYAGLKFGCRRISGRRGWGCCPCPMTRLPVVGVYQARRRICGPSVPISLRNSSPCIVAYRLTHLFFPSDSLCLSLSLGYIVAYPFHLCRSKLEANSWHCEGVNYSFLVHHRQKSDALL